MSPSNQRRSAALARSLVCAVAALAVATASCTSMQKVPVVRTSAGQPIAWQVNAGEAIRVTSRDGVITAITVQCVTPDAIIATDGTRFEHANITSVERRGNSAGKTAGAIGAGLGVAAVVFVVVGFVALFSLFGGGD